MTGESDKSDDEERTREREDGGERDCDTLAPAETAAAARRSACTRAADGRRGRKGRSSSRGWRLAGDLEVADGSSWATRRRGSAAPDMADEAASDADGVVVVRDERMALVRGCLGCEHWRRETTAARHGARQPTRGGESGDRTMAGLSDAAAAADRQRNGPDKIAARQRDTKEFTDGAKQARQQWQQQRRRQ
ncbi:hypothetical protein Scep_001966 [Stephania cephalantha]|uniref:Uncharacterized protein n=1 Tax=Stephania cephalantha TaxID=152367 RepID=A0AAP0LA51_9MAGN